MLPRAQYAARALQPISFRSSSSPGPAAQASLLSLLNCAANCRSVWSLTLICCGDAQTNITIPGYSSPIAIAQGGRHTVICGTLMPWDLDACDARGLVGSIHFLNLHCSDEVREQRLRARPAWRQSSHEAYIEQHRKFAQWLLDNAATAYNPSMQIVDTSNASVTEVAAAIARWVLTVLQGKPRREPARGSSSA